MSSGPEPPQYKVYKSRKRLRDRLRPPGSDTGGSLLGAFRKRRGKDPGRQDPYATPGPSVARRIVKYVALAVLGWLLISVLAFFISAATKPGVSDQTGQA